MLRATLFCTLLLIGAAPMHARAQVTTSHGLTILGTPELPPNFDHFPYVNPGAPKGGTVTFAMIGSFDGFNPYILGGNAAIGLGSDWQPGVGGTQSGSAGGHVYESLMVPSASEIATAYCHLCETVEQPADKMWVAFTLRPQARFSDGSPVTAQDVVWTFNELMTKGRPSVRVTFQDVKDAVAEGPRRVVFHFKSNQNRELPLLVGGLPVMSQKWWSTRDFTKPLTEAPLGSGPYKVGPFELGRSVTYVRDPNWWAATMPTGKGFYNFDRIKIEYFRDPTVAFQAFKAGQIDWRQENISKQWATGYDFPAVQQGLVKKEEIRHKLPLGIQGWIFNTRRPQFADRRVREAIGQVFDFEWMNKNLFYGAYERTTSYFGNTAQEAKGLPDAAQLALFDPFKSELPPELFSEPFTLPKTDGSGNNRAGLRRALTLLEQAGWKVKDRKLVDASGKQMTFQILLDDPSLERIALPYQQWMERLGIAISVRTVDAAQFVRLTDAYDFDMTTLIYPGSDLPGNELRDEFSCEGGKVQGGANLAGICDKAVDALVAKAIAAQDRKTLATAGQALDRVLLYGWYMVPNWHDSKFKIAAWDRFARPDAKLRTGFVLDDWWLDKAKAAKTDAAKSGGN